MLDELVKTLILSVPNVAGLLLMLFWQQRRIDQLLAMITTLTEEIVSLKNAIRANGSSASPPLPHSLN